MGKEKGSVANVGRVNLGLSAELDKRFNDYVLKVVQKKGKIPHAIKSKIARKALIEWLDKHENDLEAV